VSSVTDEIKQRIDLVELIGHSVRLRRVGSSYVGLCPFHTEKTPSFHVRPQAGSWHCFGCNKGGSAFDWLMEREHLEFSEALRVLAQQAGVELPAKRAPEDEERHARLLSILARAQTYYEGLLWGSTGSRAREYLTGRGVNEETIRSFGLGYAAHGNGLLRYLDQLSYANEQELQAAGVVSTSDDGRTFDFFRDRVLFPIRDPQGRTVAFGGRSLEDGVGPKYLNSRDTLLFHKQETLFAFDLARRSMLQEHQAVIVEGYMDAVMAHQHGYRNVVATLGTAVTDQHLRLLRRQIDEIVLALDADAAGQAATWRALQVADESLRTGLMPVVGPNRRQQRFVAGRAVRLRVLALPGAKDPDDLIRENPATWPTLVQGAIPVIDFVLQRVGARHDLASARGKSQAAEEIAEVLAGIAGPIEQDFYVQQAAQLLKTNDGAVRQLVRRRKRGGAAAQPPPSRSGPGDTIDEYLLALLMRLRELPQVHVPIEGRLEFIHDESRALYEALGSDLPAWLDEYAAGARTWLEAVRRLPAEQLSAEIEQTRRSIRGELLRRQQAQIRQEIRDHGEVAAGIDFAEALGQIARQIRDLEEVPREREKAATR
jgi:DNA primase